MPGVIIRDNAVIGARSAGINPFGAMPLPAKPMQDSQTQSAVSTTNQSDWQCICPLIEKERMINMKKWLSILLSMTLVFSLTACSGGTTSREDENSEPPAISSEPSSEAPSISEEPSSSEPPEESVEPTEEIGGTLVLISPGPATLKDGADHSDRNGRRSL